MEWFQQAWEFGWRRNDMFKLLWELTLFAPVIWVHFLLHQKTTWPPWLTLLSMLERLRSGLWVCWLLILDRSVYGTVYAATWTPRVMRMFIAHLKRYHKWMGPSEKVQQLDYFQRRSHWWSLLRGICWLDISTRSLLLWSIWSNGISKKWTQHLF